MNANGLPIVSRLLALMTSCLLLSGCPNEPSPEEFIPPVMGTVSVKPSTFCADFNCRIEGNGNTILSFGFELSPAEPGSEPVILQADFFGGFFSARARNLEKQSSYRVCAFIDNGKTKYRSEYASFSTTDGPEQAVIADSLLRAAVDGYDINDDGVISTTEAKDVHTIVIDNLQVTSLDGLEFFSNLDLFSCNGCGLDRLDVSSLAELKELYCNGNRIASLSLEENSKLEILHCSGNALTELDLSHNRQLKEVQCAGNPNLASVILHYGHEITGITSNRSNDYVSEHTAILTRYELFALWGNDETGKGIVYWISDDGFQANILSAEEINFYTWQASINWCHSYGDGGWDLPQIDELTKIHLLYNQINSKLIENGFTPLTSENYCYWSKTSNESNDSYAYREKLSSGQIFNMGSDERKASWNNFARAVRIIR